MVNFLDALNTKAEDIQRPPLLPAGYYLMKVSGAYEHREVEMQGEPRDVLDIPVAVVSPYRDDDGDLVGIDEDTLEEFGDPAGVPLRQTFILPRDQSSQDFKRTMHRLKTFLVQHLQLSEEGTLAEMLSEAIGAEFIGQVTHQPDKRDPEIVYARLSRTQAAD